MFRALVVEAGEGRPTAAVQSLDESALPEGDVLVEVTHSTVNYKDGMAVRDGRPVVRSFPMVPGIDLAGTVLESSHAQFRPGDVVVANGFGLGEGHWGGFAQRARVKGTGSFASPDPLTPAQAMAIGTAGYTAMLSVLALERAGIAPGDGDILVTGAAGGVGSVSIALLAAAGHRVVASTGRPEESEYLRSLGAAEIIPRSELSEPSKRPMAAERWAGAVDSVGGVTLANVLAATRYLGTVAACGLAGGTDVPTTVYPFIIRGVTLVGIDSVMAPMSRRAEAWQRLASDLDLDVLAGMTSTIALADVPDTAAAILAGQVRGRVVVDVNG